MAVAPPGASSRTVTATRLGYLDWLRGVAVLIMVEAHAVDSWTQAGDRGSWLYGRLTIFNGGGSILFLFLTGVAVALSAGSKARKHGSLPEAAAAVRRRGWEIFGLAFLFRLQSYLLNPGASAVAILKVDILNVMGLAIVLASLLWPLGRSAATRLLIFVAATFGIAMVTPVVRAAEWLAWLPDPVEWYVRPSPGHSNFVLFPWIGFVFGGCAVGAIIDRRESGWLTSALFLGVGTTMALAGYSASFEPSIYRSSNFWTTSPTFFFIRLGILIASVALAYVWDRLRGPDRWSPLQQFGRTSLFIYWIHVEMVYGGLSAPLHKRLSLPQALIATALFTFFLFGLSLLKTWLAAKWKARRQ
jgi:uncharacterized membrane protein